MPDKIIGFSKLSRDKKISWINKNFLDNSNEFESILNKYLNDDKNIQSIHNSLSENVISNFHLPYSISPNFLINNKNYCIPLVTEESSVVAALSNSSKFWYDRGGFKSKVLSKIKTGQVHFKYDGNAEILEKFIIENEHRLIESTDRITKKMRERDPKLPEFMPPGPDNPLGSHALYLSWPSYRIHGTSDTRKIGRKSSSGCIGLYNEQIEELFNLVEIGTPVKIL